MSRPVRLVVFDLDDTLYLEADFVRSGFAAVESALGIRGLAATAWALHAAGLRGTVLTEALRRHASDEVAHAVAIYRCHRPRIALAPDAAAALAVLAPHAATELALLSDGDAGTQRNKIEALDLTRWIPRITLTDELGPNRARWKPHPEGFQRLQGARASTECVYVADNPRKDFDAPARLGWRTVRVCRAGGLWASDPDGAVRPDATVADLTGLADRLDAIGVR